MTSFLSLDKKLTTGNEFWKNEENHASRYYHSFSSLKISRKSIQPSPNTLHTKKRENNKKKERKKPTKITILRSSVGKDLNGKFYFNTLKVLCIYQYKDSFKGGLDPASNSLKGFFPLKYFKKNIYKHSFKKIKTKTVGVYFLLLALRCI